MGGSSPSVFHTAPPQPASKARLTLYALSVGGAEASQNGLGDLMPRNVVVRSAMSFLPQKTVDGERGDFAVLHGGDGEILAAEHAITAGPHAGQRSAPLVVHEDPVLLQVENLRGVGEMLPQDFLADGLEHHVRFENVSLSGDLRGLELHAAYASRFHEKFSGLRPQPQRHATSLRELLLVSAGVHVLLATAVDHGHLL